jgi:ribosomal protein S18 acetylase RimI-like enzyme
MVVRSLAFRTDLALLALAGAEIEDHGSRLVIRTPENPTYYWGNFYLLAEPPGEDAVEALIEAYDKDFPDSSHRALGVDGTDVQAVALEPLITSGLELESSTVMTATAVNPPPRPNAAAEYRMFATDGDWAQRIEVATAVHDDRDPERYREFAVRKAAHDRAVCDAGHGAWWGAFVEGRLASVMGIIDAGDGLARYQSVETHPDYRNRGLAGTLVHRVARYAFDERGASTLVMVADPGYSAIRVYRSVGFTDTETQTQLIQRTRSFGTEGR